MTSAALLACPLVEGPTVKLGATVAIDARFLRGSLYSLTPVPAT